MYVVLDKFDIKKIIHINMSPLSQVLKDKEVFYNYDPEIHVIGKTDADVLPEHYKIDEGFIRELTIQEKVSQAIIILDPDQKIKNNEIVEKTIQEKIDDGIWDIVNIRDEHKAFIKDVIINHILKKFLNDELDKDLALKSKYDSKCAMIDDAGNYDDIIKVEITDEDLG